VAEMKVIKSAHRLAQCREASTRYRATHPEYLEKARLRSLARYRSDPAARRAERRKWCTDNPEKYIFSSAKSRAKKAKECFTISLEEVVIPEFCPCLGIKLELFGEAYNSPSLDRIDNTKGYVKGNVQVISQRANRCKSNLTKLEMVLVARAFLEWGQS